MRYCLYYRLINEDRDRFYRDYPTLRMATYEADLLIGRAGVARTRVIPLPKEGKYAPLCV